jgi:hypothetical protein
MTSDPVDIEEVLKALTGRPVMLDVAKGREGLPSARGLYAWWTVQGSIPGVPRCPHASEDLDLFYVGIAPKDSFSQATLRSRVVDNHIKGNTGSSTFKKTLASLLFEAMGWRPRFTDRPLLSVADNATLRNWQHQNLRLTWAEHPEPWNVENVVIARLQPPLNLAGNSAHPFHGVLSSARKRFKSAGESGSTAEPVGNRVKEPPIRSNEQRPSGGSVKLHDEIADILRERGNGWMTTQQIADQVAHRKRYVKRDGSSDVSAFQIHGRTKESGSYSHLFDRQGSRVRLRTP